MFAHVRWSVIVGNMEIDENEPEIDPADIIGNKMSFCDAVACKVSVPAKVAVPDTTIAVRLVVITTVTLLVGTRDNAPSITSC